MEIYTWVKTIDYPRDPETQMITATIHPQLQVQSVHAVPLQPPLVDIYIHWYVNKLLSVFFSIMPQDHDFCLLHQGDPLFLTFSGNTEYYKGAEPLYPFFVNESAYYEKGIAVLLARKKEVNIPSIRVMTRESVWMKDWNYGMTTHELEAGIKNGHCTGKTITSHLINNLRNVSVLDKPE